VTTYSRAIAVYPQGKNGLVIPGSLSSVVSSETARRSLRAFGNSLRAIVVTGSLARGEETVELESGYKIVLGDAEFLLVFHPNVALPR